MSTLLFKNVCSLAHGNFGGGGELTRRPFPHSPERLYQPPLESNLPNTTLFVLLLLLSKIPYVIVSIAVIVMGCHWWTASQSSTSSFISTSPLQSRDGCLWIAVNRSTLYVLGARQLGADQPRKKGFFEEERGGDEEEASCRRVDVQERKRRVMWEAEQGWSERN